MRQEPRRVTEAHLPSMVAHCDERLGGMRREQRNYHDGDVAMNQPALTKAHRRFREEHSAFLVAGYALGDALRRAVVRPFMNAEVDPFFAGQVGAFHRELRNCIAHGEELQYGITMNIEFRL